jgi:mannose-1-phosphate guanylyltransferase/mannose-6-phosphate isomerase
VKAIILAGGGGTRLWPLSRKNFPKQFLKLNGDRSLLRQTADRLSKTIRPEDILIITNKDYKFYVKADLPEFPNIILEPEARNTAPAIALGIKYCIEKLGSSDDDVIFVAPSDHIIKPAEKFAKYISLANDMAKQGYIVTFGVKPNKPETGYGYIKIKGQKSKSTNKKFYQVECFVEKPDLKTAKKYMSSGNYFWNSGMFAFSIKTIVSEMRKHAPDIAKTLSMSLDSMCAGFGKMPNTSIDYSVMEKSDRVGIIPLKLYWNDIGSWDALYDVLEKDKNGNVKLGDSVCVDTNDTLIIGDKRLTATVGIKNCLIVETGDALLVAKRGETQKVKDIVRKLIENKRKEADEHVTIYRPWGSYTILEESLRYKVKKIAVKPFEKLSLQLHKHRSEHWVVVKGTAKVTINDKEILLNENESAYVPKETLHRLENPVGVPLEIIEVQSGEYVGEDDIKRVEDVYGR